MKEYITNALVLGRRPHRERDWMVDLFTDSFGPIRARIVGGARPGSKLSPHFDPAVLVLVRLVKTNQFTVVDVSTTDRFPALRADVAAFGTALELLMLVRRLAPPHVADHALWTHLTESFARGAAPMRAVLIALGHDPSGAQCASCGRSPVAVLVLSEHTYYCVLCARSFPSADQVGIL